MPFTPGTGIFVLKPCRSTVWSRLGLKWTQISTAAAKWLLPTALIWIPNLTNTGSEDSIKTQIMLYVHITSVGLWFWSSTSLGFPRTIQAPLQPIPVSVTWFRDKSHLLRSVRSANRSKHSLITFNCFLMGREAKPLHHHTSLTSGACCPVTLSVAPRAVSVHFILSSHFVNHVLRCHSCSRCVHSHFQGCVIRTLTTWAIFQTDKVLAGCPTAVQGRPVGCRRTTAGRESRVWPKAQSGRHWCTLPAAIFLLFLHVSLPLLHSFFLFSGLFLELADFYF